MEIILNYILNVIDNPKRVVSDVSIMFLLMVKMMILISMLEGLSNLGKYL